MRRILRTLLFLCALTALSAGCAHADLPAVVPVSALELTCVQTLPGAEGEAPVVQEVETSSLRVGETVQLTLAFVPENTTQRSVTYYSTNTRVATVDRTGLVTAMNAGTVVIRAISMHDSRIRAAYSVYVVQYPESVQFTRAPEQIAVGAVAQAAAAVLPKSVKNKAVSYAVSDESVAVVDERGRVRGVAPGTVTLSVTSHMSPEISASVEIRVVQRVQALAYTPGEVDMIVGETLQPVIAFTPQDASDQRLTYRSGNPRVATVDETGRVTAVGRGKATITAVASDGSKKTARLQVRVEAADADAKR